MPDASMARRRAEQDAEHVNYNLLEQKCIDFESITSGS
jgi:hypothetical protein